MATNRSENYSGSETTDLLTVERELETRLRQQEVLTRIGHIALAISSLEELFDETVDLIAETLDVEYCEVLKLLPEEEQLFLISGTGWKDGYVGQARVGTEVESQAGYTLLQNGPVILSDLGDESRFSAPALLFDHDVTSGMTVVIPGKTGPFGVLGVHSTTARNFTRVDANFLQAVANLLASAIARLSVEASLRTSRDELKIVLEGVADGITVQDPTGRLVYANEAAADLIGYSSVHRLLEAPLKEIMQRFELFDEEGNPFPAENLPGRRALQGHGPNSASIRFRTKATGEERWSYVKSTPVLDQDGRVKLAVNIFQDVTDLKRKDQHQRLLADASEVMYSSLDYATTLRRVARMVVPNLADWCAVHIIKGDGSVEQLAVAHADPDKMARALELSQRYPPDPSSPAGIYQVIRSGKPALFPDITEDLIEQVAQDGEHYEILRSMRIKSALMLPLKARDEILGVLTLIWSDSGRRYNQADVELAQELARRATIAIQNASLYQRAQQLNEELEARVTKRTSQLQRLINSLRNEIEERNKAEQALRESETMLQNLFTSAPDATILVDKEGKIVQMNRQVQALFGYNQDELIGKPIDVLLPRRFRSAHTKHRQKYMSNPRLRTMGAELDLLAQRKDGSEFAVDVMLSPLETEQGAMVISAVRDISESKRIQAELAELQRRLIDHLESERTKLAQELHDGPIQDIYAMLYRIKGMTAVDKTGQETAMDELAGGLAGDAENVIQALRAICGELRPPSLAPYGLEKAIREHAANFQKSHQEIKVHLDLTSDGQDLPENVRFALFRVYQNAISNVMRHSQAENVSICFGLDEERAVLVIEDDGKGFELPSRWLKFARKGHLGLVGSVERVKAISGRIDISSSPGNGTSIRVIVPRK